MIKQIIIRILLVVMVIAFSAVVVVQWLWIKYAIREREKKFTSQVYEVLNRVSYRIDEINYIKYLRSQDYKSEISVGASGMIANISSALIFDFFDRDSSNSVGERTYLTPRNLPNLMMWQERMITQEFISQAVRSVQITGRDTVGGQMMLKRFMLRLLREKDPQNASINERLADIDIKGLLTSNFKTYNIKLPFTYEILSKQDIIRQVEEGDTHNFYYVELFSQDLVRKGYNLGVRFKTVQPVILENMGWLFLASGFCIFGLMFVFIITIVIIMRQQKLSVIKNDFINNMTHEFKTPIATISLATSAIAKEKVLNDKEQILKFNEMIKSENERMNKYVERILQQAKLDRREVNLNKTDVDVNLLLKEVIGHFLLQVQSEGGKLEFKPDCPDFILYADEVHLMNVFCNLVDNAIKYSGGAPDVFVYTRRNGNARVIGVQDHGIGISKEAQKKVFDRFYRVPSGNLHNVKGCGLGLNYVKSIVELHGGIIRLTSKKNKGTLVEIEFK